MALWTGLRNGRSWFSTWSGALQYFALYQTLRLRDRSNLWLEMARRVAVAPRAQDESAGDSTSLPNAIGQSSVGPADWTASAPRSARQGIACGRTHTVSARKGVQFWGTL